MRQHHALGESRGAARVRQYREIPRRVDRSARGRRGGLEQGPERRGAGRAAQNEDRSEEHTSELQSRLHLVCRLLLEKKKKYKQAEQCRQPYRKRMPASAKTD